MIGTKINNLTIIKDLGQVHYETKSGFKRNRRRVIVRCVCGKEKEVSLSEMKFRQFVSCGCMKKPGLKHGLRHEVLYTIWDSMRSRCNNEQHKSFARYGGRGIKVCCEWANDFKPFYEWAILNGYKKGLQIDRIDNNMGYSPNNCRFVTAKENANNKADTIMIEFDNKIQSISDWAAEKGINYNTLKWRFYNGWDAKRMLTNV